MVFRLLLPLLLLSATVATAQPVNEKATLEAERKEIQRELNEIQQQYDQVKSQKKQTLSQLNLLNRKIQLQERYLNSINREIRNIEDNIYLSELEIYRLNKQLDTLRVQYARSVVYAYRYRSNYDYINFIFSASNFNDALKRMDYLRTYRAHREKQVANIEDHQRLIAARQKEQLVRKEEKSQVMTVQAKKVDELGQERKQKDAVVNQLKSKEREFQKQIAAKKKRDKELLSSINAIVKREIEAARAKAKATAPKTGDPRPEDKGTVGGGGSRRIDPNPTSKPTYLDLTARDVELNSGFQNNRGRLPWPVDNGVVTSNFGPNKIENTLLTFDNPGISISTPNSGMAVKAVFDGDVIGVFNLGDGMAVTIRHGKYFTTYSNLTSVSVSKGTAVKTGQSIGKTGRSEEGDGGQVDLILMMETKNIDPKPWLRR
ncbi:MAG: murein hydrolase activator EnvC family protein [Bacteroidota bacterium]|jgi:septal ring factor EnvC (AmiA/AmiB activator)